MRVFISRCLEDTELRCEDLNYATVNAAIIVSGFYHILTQTMAEKRILALLVNIVFSLQDILTVCTYQSYFRLRAHGLIVSVLTTW